jgi:branched-subunit amino acid transport protein
LSADRLAPIGRSLYFLVGDIDPRIAGAMASGVTAFAALGFYARCVASLPRIGRFHFVTPAATFALGVGVCAMGSAGVLSSPDDRLAQALIVSAGRILELSGLTLALGELIAHARAQSSRMFLHIDHAAPRMLTARQDGDRLDVTVSPLAIARIIALIVTALLAVSFVTAVGRTLLGWDIERWYRLFFVDFEGNLPTWFSSVLLFSSGAVLAAIAATSRDRGDRCWRYWRLMAALLVALSADEAASFHEMTVYPLRSLLGGNPWLRYPLIIPGSIGAAAAVVMFRGFVRTLPAATCRGLSAGAGLFLFGAIGIETVAGWFDPVVHGDNLPYILLATFEEACEFAGAAMVLHALLRHVEIALAPMEISVRP